MIKYIQKTGPEERKALSYISLEKTAFAKRTKLISVLCTIVGVLSLYLSVKSLIHYGINNSDLIMLIIALFIIYMGLDGTKRLQKLYFKKDITPDCNAKETECEFLINAEGITKISCNTQKFEKWSVFKTWSEYEHYIYLRKKDDEITLIDKKLLNKEEIKELTTYLKINIK